MMRQPFFASAARLNGRGEPAVQVDNLPGDKPFLSVQSEQV